MPEPAISNTLNADMYYLPALLADDRGHQFLETRIEKGERGLIAHRVLGKRRLLELRVDRIAVERRRHRHAIFKVGAERRIREARVLAAEVRGIGGRDRNTAGRGGGGARAAAGIAGGGGERSFEIDIARFVVRRVGV